MGKQACRIGNFRLAEAAHNTWHDYAESGVAYEDILKPEYWAHVSKQVMVNDHIQVTAKDGSFFAWLMVEAATGTGLFVSEILVRNGASEPAQAEDGAFRVEHVSGKHRWRIVRLSDNVVMDSGYPNEQYAKEAMYKLLGRVSEESKSDTKVE